MMEGQENIELKLWEYIDGLCDAQEHAAVTKRIANDTAWLSKYNELIAFNETLVHGLELDEPSIRFNKNVMEMVSATQIAPSINTYINPLIIKGIAAVLLLSIGLVTAFALSSIQWNEPGTSMLSKISLPDFHAGKYFNSTFINAAIAINVILALLFADTVLRKKGVRESVKKQ